MFEDFKREMGSPEQGTASTLDELGLTQSSTLRRFGEEVGFGRFKDGLFSIVSVRERVPGIGGWERVYPDGVRVFASSAFGWLWLTTTGEDVWMLEPNYGTVGDTDMPMAEVINMLADPAVREEHLHEKLFEQYGIPLKPANVLSPTPAIALAGYWSPECLREAQLPEFLSFTAGLVMPQVLADASGGSDGS
jgi:hypothetical protein